MGRYKDALSAYEKASSLKRDKPLYHYNRAIALHRLGKTTKAIDSLNNALRLKPDFEDAQEALQHISRGHTVWWWEWWFGESWHKKAVGIFLSALLTIYLLLPLFQEGAVLPGSFSGLAWNPGKGYQHYIVPVAAILLLLILPNISRLGPQGVELSPLPSEEGIKLAPLESMAAAETIKEQKAS